MKIVIFGANETGSVIATEFFEEHDVIVIDPDAKKINEFANLDLNFVCSEGSDIKTLTDIDIKTADVFIACTTSDEANFVACFTVKQLSEAKTICFVTKAQYIENIQFVKENFYKQASAVDYVIWPEELLTQEIFRIITVPEALDVENFADGRARLLEYRIKENSPMINKKIRNVDFNADTLIVGISRGEDLFIPDGNSRFEAGDKIIFIGKVKALDITASKFLTEKEKIKQATIIGGGSVGFMLAQNMIKAGIRVKIIEKDEARSEFLSEQLTNALVLNANGTDLKLLEEEEVNLSDVVVAVTNSDEKNLLCSLLSKQIGAKRVVTRVSQIKSASLFEKVGVDVAISPKEASMNEIKNIIFASDHCDILATVDRGKGEVLELVVRSDFKEISLKDIQLPQKAIVAIIKRGNNVIIPKGDTLIKPCDGIILFTKTGNSDEIKEFFKK